MILQFYVLLVYLVDTITSQACLSIDANLLDLCSHDIQVQYSAVG